MLNFTICVTFPATNVLSGTTPYIFYNLNRYNDRVTQNDIKIGKKGGMIQVKVSKSLKRIKIPKSLSIIKYKNPPYIAKQQIAKPIVNLKTYLKYGKLFGYYLFFENINF